MHTRVTMMHFWAQPLPSFATRIGLGVAIALASAACSSGSSSSSSAPSSDSNAEGALSSTAPVKGTISFDGSGDGSVSGQLVAGAKARIHYDASRLSKCRSNLDDGSPGWVITGYKSLNGESPKAFYVAGHSSDPRIDSASPPDPTIDLTKGGDLAVWFMIHDQSGCHDYDSKGGDNFHFTVDDSPGVGASATVKFGASGAPIVSGDLVEGGTLEIDYDADRLPACRGGSAAHPMWTLTGFASTNGGRAKPFYVAGNSEDGSIDVTNPPPAKITLSEAGEVALWFQVTGSAGCSKYDSVGGENYKFRVRGN